MSKRNRGSSRCPGCLLLGLCVAVVSGTAGAAGLSVGENGILLKDGRPFRAIGVNYADAFWRTLDPSDTSYEEGFADLADLGIPFARVPVSYYFADDLQLFLTDEQEFLRRLDGVIQAAEDHGIGLIPSLFWEESAVPDLVGETLIEWGNLESETIAFMRAFTQTIVSRYKDSPAIWAWEFGNEYNLGLDFRTIGDTFLTTAMYLVAWQEFATVVRSIDPSRPITTGNSMSRPTAESLRLTGKWFPLDDRDDYKANLALVNPSPHNMISIHMYPGVLTLDFFESGYFTTYGELLSLFTEVSTAEGKPLFVGEWGVSSFDFPTEEEIAEHFSVLLDALVDGGVPLAAVWNFDWVMPDNEQQLHELNITRTNSHSYMLDVIAAANATISNRITSSGSSGFIAAGTVLELTAPKGSNYQWKKEGIPVSDDAPRITGANSRTLRFDPVQEEDAGTYTCEYDMVAKARVETDPFDLDVLPEGSLPAGALTALGALVAVLGVAGAAHVRKTRI